MKEIEFRQTVEKIIQSDPRYPVDAYVFVNEVVLHIHRKRERDGVAGEKRNIAGGELLEGFKELALKEFGPLADEVLREWNVRGGVDVGNIVFNLVDFKIFRKAADESIEDFKRCFDFEEAFHAPFRVEAHVKPSSPVIIA